MEENDYEPKIDPKYYNLTPAQLDEESEVELPYIPQEVEISIIPPTVSRKQPQS